MSKTLILGGTGLLGKALKAIDPDLVCLGRNECDIRYKSDIANYVFNYDLVILCAASLDNDDSYELISNNIMGSAKVAKECIEANKRLVYISTDYVYPCQTGNHKEMDALLPFNDYAWSKLGGECAVRLVPNHLIIRTSFGDSEFPYDVAYNNKWTSKDYVDIIAPMILQAAQSELQGILNIGTEKKTIFDFASQRNEVKGKPLTDNSSPRDSSLNLDKWKAFQKSIANADAVETID